MLCISLWSTHIVTCTDSPYITALQTGNIPVVVLPMVTCPVRCLQKQQGTLTRVGNKHLTMGGHYAKGRRWRVEERHRFYTNQLYPNDVDSATGYKEQFRQVGRVYS